MSMSETTNTQARMLFTTMFKLFQPYMRSTDLQTTNGSEEISLGSEVDDFAIELEKFIVGVISRSQHGRKDVSVDVVLPDVPAEPKVLIDGSSNDGTTEISNFLKVFVPLSDVSSHVDAASEASAVHGGDEILADNLRKDLAQFQNECEGLREHIAREMPIRMLCFEPHASGLNITLLGRSDIFNHIYPRILADYHKLGNSQPQYYSWLRKYVSYAILSHTWSRTPGELTYGDWHKGLLNTDDPRSQKLFNFCKVAWENHGLSFGWIDTVCINKESSSELDESIRSMYKWYQQSDICITYLAGTEKLSNLQHDPWFTRGWTLQELVAPKHVKFYNMHWRKLVKKDVASDHYHPPIMKSIESATTITQHEMWDIRSAPISRRMQLAARRKVTRAEDMAYSLMGIFGVSISTAYGEGAEHAFFRLLKEIFDSTRDVSDIFNWGCPTRGDIHNLSFWASTTSLFPPSPIYYLTRSTNPKLRPWRPMKPLTLTHFGLRTPMLLMPATPNFEFDEEGRPLPGEHQPIGDYYAKVFINPHRRPHFNFVPTRYLLLDKKVVYAPAFPRSKTWTFGTLNVEAHGTKIHIPKTCIAVLLTLNRDASTDSTQSIGHERKIPTQHPIVFDLEEQSNNSINSGDGEHGGSRDYYVIEKTELESHGMRLITLYL